jgi:hypothetical protein
MPLPFDLITTIILSLSLVAVIVLAVFLHYAIEHWYYSHVIVPRTLNWVFLEIQVPKESADEAKSQSEEQRKSLIALAEQLFTTLSESGGKDGFFKRKDYLSFEIACTAKKISFYINCPRSLQQLVEKQVQAQYPHAFIEEVKGYNPFQKGGQVEAVELQLNKQYVYPVRTYKSMESDPLNSLTNAMSKLGDDEGIAIQYIFRPAGNDWQDYPRKIALDIQQGKNPKAVEKAQSGFFGLIFSDLVNIVKGKSSSDPLAGEKTIALTPMQQDIVKRLEEKASRPGYNANIRMVASSMTPGAAKVHLSDLVSSFLQYNMPPFNGFRLYKRKAGDVVKDYVFRIYRKKNALLLNTEELASLWHLPTPFLETPNINWLQSKKAPAPNNVPQTGVLLGRNIYRGVETPIRIARDDRRRHMYIVGRTGSGKTEIMKTMSVQDIVAGEGVCIIDPHGDFIEDVLPHIPKERAEDVVLFEPFDTERPMGLNMLEVRSESEKDFAVQEMISIFYKLVTDPAMLGPMFEHNMRNAMLTLMADEEHPGTIVDIPRIFTDMDFQKYKVSKLKDPIVRAFWEKEMAKTSDYHKSEMLGYLVSKVGRFVENTMIRNIVGQAKSSFNFRDVMDGKKILLVNLAKGKVGEINAKLLGLIIVSKLQMAALSRADMPESERNDFYLYVDEFQNFITDAFSTILSEARKYRLNLVIAHQFLAQLGQGAGSHGAASGDLRDAVFGNAGSMVTFRIGVEDAEIFAKEFAPTFSQFDLVNIERYNALMKLMINGTASKPFNMGTYPLAKPTADELSRGAAIRQLSRLKFGRPLADVEREILESTMIADMMAAGPASIEKSN